MRRPEGETERMANPFHRVVHESAHREFPLFTAGNMTTEQAIRNPPNKNPAGRHPARALAADLLRASRVLALRHGRVVSRPLS
ncbi:hypothetical protein ACGF5O_28320 [Streptomyces sp. NPDC048291]|uniref:hypothetical protein n=1 Tax=Streptomyces sp. NPDC048291 TaxID=3365530 RepID=UPI003715DEC7